MNALTGKPLLDHGASAARSRPATAQLANPYSKDAQVQAIRNARVPRRPAGRVASPHKILDPAAGPLIGVKLHILTRKTLGGIQTDLDSRCCSGLYAAGEVAGFGGGGDGNEGTFRSCPGLYAAGEV
jgi:predicted oxidoreductase